MAAPWAHSCRVGGPAGAAGEVAGTAAGAWARRAGAARAATRKEKISFFMGEG